MTSLSAIILGYALKGMPLYYEFGAMFIQQKFKTTQHLGGSLVWHFSFKAVFHGEQLRPRIFKNELIELNADWKLHSARGLMAFKN